MWDQVKNRIDRIRPMFAGGSGDLELVAVDNGAVEIRLKRAPGESDLSEITLKKIIEIQLQGIPGIVSVKLI